MRTARNLIRAGALRPSSAIDAAAGAVVPCDKRSLAGRTNAPTNHAPITSPNSHDRQPAASRRPRGGGGRLGELLG